MPSASRLERPRDPLRTGRTWVLLFFSMLHFATHGTGRKPRATRACPPVDAIDDHGRYSLGVVGAVNDDGARRNVYRHHAAGVLILSSSRPPGAREVEGARYDIVLAERLG